MRPRPDQILTLAQLLDEPTVFGTVRVKIGKDIFQFSGLDRIYYPKVEITKLDIMRYYHTVRTAILPHLRQRPLTLRRMPEGILGRGIWQHDLRSAPSELSTVEIQSKTQGMKRYALANDVGDVLYLVNLGTIAQNPYLCKVSDLDAPTWMVFDLDPGPKASFDDVRQVALETKSVIEEAGLRPLAKTSGKTGMHVFVGLKPRYTFKQVTEVARELAQEVVRRQPAIATTVRSVAQRPAGAVYVDYLQNAYGKSIAAPYSLREVVGAPVSAPVTWLEVKRGFRPTDFNIESMPARLTKRGDLFEEVLKGQALPEL